MNLRPWFAFTEASVAAGSELRKELRRAANAPVTPGANLRAMRDYYIKSLRHPTWNVLFLEYKPFSLRHPRLKSKISNTKTRVLATAAVIVEAIDAARGTTLPVSTLAAATSLDALVNSLGIDRLVGNTITARELDAVLNLFFDAIANGRHKETVSSRDDRTGT
jgi:hypothetical protein